MPVTANGGAVPCTCMSARLESPSASKAEFRMKSARSVRLRVLATVKSHARKRSREPIPDCLSVIRISSMCGRRASISGSPVGRPVR